MGTTAFSDAITTDASFNKRILVGSDVSLGGRLFVMGTTAFSDAITTDASFNKRLLVGSDVSLGGRLFVQGTTAFSDAITTDASFNKRILVGSDVSLGGRLFVMGTTAFADAITTDASFNKRVLVGSDVSLGGRLYVSGTTSLTGDVSMNGNLQVSGYVLASMFQINNFPMVLSAQTTSATVSSLTVLNDSSFNGNVQIGNSLRIANGITPIYTTPSFTQNQIGYSYTATLATDQNYTSLSTATNVNNCSVSLNAGVYIVNTYIYGSCSSGSYVATYVNNTPNTAGNNLTKWLNLSTTTSFEIPGVSTITANNETWYFVFYANSSSTIRGANVKYTRIA
jgi:hypothetical protein